MEVLNLHFNLSEHDQNKTYFIHGHGSKQELKPYAQNPEKLEEHKQINTSLALLSKEHEHKITHYIEDIKLPKNSITRLSVVSPAENKDDILPDLISVHDHIPQRVLKHTYIKKGFSDSIAPMIVSHLGIDQSQITAQNFADVHSHAALTILPPLAIAQTIVTSHPEIGTINPTDAGHIYSTYLQNQSDFTDFINYISNNPQSGDNPWSKKTYAIKADPKTGEISPAVPTIRKFKNGKVVNWPTIDDPKDPSSKIHVIPQYELSDETSGAKDGGVMAAAAPVIFSVLKQTKNDKKLSGAIWTRSTGSITSTKSNVSPVKPVQPTADSLDKPTSFSTKVSPIAEVAEVDSSHWSVKCDSSKQYGLDLYASDLSFSDNTVSFPVKNWPSRYLSVYVEYLKEDGTPIRWSTLKNSKEGDKLVQPDGVISDAFALAFAPKKDSTTKLFWGVLGSGNAVFGVPFPTNPVDIKFQWPHDQNGNEIASKAKVYVGGLGAANGFLDWDTDVDLAGLIATGLLNYGLIAASMVFSVAVVGPAKKLFMKSKIRYAVLALAINIGVVAVVVSSFFWKSGTAKGILSKISNFVAGFIFGSVANLAIAKYYEDAVEEMIEAFAGNLTAQEALEQIPYAGWALKASSLAGDIAALAATTIECVLSPTTYEMQVQQTMNLTVTVSPDPRHGTEHQAPIWPMVSDHWIIKLKYPKYTVSKTQSWNGGTTFVKAGPMPGQHDAPIEVTFENVPAGGQIEITAHIYSSDNWLAGQWQSGPKPATPNIETGDLAYSGAIVENLVPLTPSTNYSEKQRLGFDSENNKHIWVGTEFTINGKFFETLQRNELTKGLYEAFAANGVILPKHSDLVVKQVSPLEKWTITEKNTTNVYTLIYKNIFGTSPEDSVFEFEVHNTGRPAPPLPNPKTVCDTSGSNHNLCNLVNTTINNKAYQLGYAWRASGMNMPIDLSSNSPENTQMFTMQSVSTLNEPSDLILQSKLGFSQMPFIAYNQFGLTPLFNLDFKTYADELNKANNKAIPSNVRTAFSNLQFNLGDGLIVDVVQENQEWRFEDKSGNVAFDLLYTTEVVKGVRIPIINVYNYLVPENTNFYMDPRPGPKSNYHLRGVSFNGGIPGSYTFDTDFDKNEVNSWGAFPIGNLKSTIYKIAVHPAGYAIAIDYSLDKMWALPLPHDVMKMEDAPLAMPLSGTGLLEGLMNQPKAMTITADGRILILEEGNSRMQTFDVNGNPVTGFNGPLKFEIPNSFIKALDDSGQMVSEEVKKVYQKMIEIDYLRQPLFQEFDNTPVAGLDKGTVGSTLLSYFKQNHVSLPDSESDIEVTVNIQGSAWLIKDKTSEFVFDVRWDNDMFALYVFSSANLNVAVVAEGKIWEIRDTMNSLTFKITAGNKEDDPLTVQQLISYAPLRTIKDKTVEYLDIAVEDKGFIYVLFSESPGTSAGQYMLDIYNPDGSVLLDNPITGMAAAKMSVDQWRTLWSLNYETFLGPNNRTEPTVSGWIPSTPEGKSPT